ncbi:MAG TPA: cupin domain-containing protein [Acidimicrobiales bacterium]|nr:cupin domain-containing protein [Acidimicrobiales bacterium]
MASGDTVRIVRAHERRPADPTPGMVREEAVTAAGLWAGLVKTEAGASSGWHHHGDHETAIYVASGRLRMESGPGGGQTVEAGVGDFVHVPAGAVHRESNPGAEESELVVVRSGMGPTTVNVDGPDAV